MTDAPLEQQIGQMVVTASNYLENGAVTEAERLFGEAGKLTLKLREAQQQQGLERVVDAAAVNLPFFYFVQGRGYYNLAITKDEGTSNVLTKEVAKYLETAVGKFELAYAAFISLEEHLKLTIEDYSTIFHTGSRWYDLLSNTFEFWIDSCMYLAMSSENLGSRLINEGSR